MMLGTAGHLWTVPDVSFGERAGMRSRAAISRRALLLAALLALTLGTALPGGFSGGRTSVLPAKHPGLLAHKGLLSLPLAAQGPVSQALGASSPAYRVDAAASGLQAISPAQRLYLRFNSSGVAVSSGTLKLGLGLRAVGYGTSLTAVGAVSPSAKANRVSYSHAGLSEWYVNGPLGVEQGFTLPRAPSAHASGPLTLSMALTGNAHAALGPDGRSLTLSHPGTSSLLYKGLTATDASGHRMRVWLQLQEGMVLLRVAAQHARYPVRIDPFIQQGEAFTGSGEVGGGEFGFSVALSRDGNTALIGGRADNSNVGAAWVFTRSGSTWSQQGAKLTQNEISGGIEFGFSVALSEDGNTALIGAYRNGVPAEAAWVFSRSGTTWAQQGKALIGTAVAGSYFGYGVALSADGKSALISAPFAFSDGVASHGSVWSFTRSGSTWTQQGEPFTDNVKSTEGFGWGLALSDDGGTAIIARRRDVIASGIAAAWAFTRIEGKWTQQSQELVGSGQLERACCKMSVAVSANGDTALIGVPQDHKEAGAAWVFNRSGSTWTQQSGKLIGGGEERGGEFGSGVALSSDGDTALIGGPGDFGELQDGIGAAWAFGRSGSSWTQRGSKFTYGGANTSYAGHFGTAVALDGDGGTAIIGGTPAQAAGKAWVFVVPPPTVTKIKPTKGPVAGGTEVTITGTNLEGATSVKFGVINGTNLTIRSNTSITADSPAESAGTVDVTVTTPGGNSAISTKDRFKFVPSVTNVTPNTGSKVGGTSVTITGTGFALGATATVFKFGTTKAKPVNCTSTTTCTASAPAHAVGTVDVKATVNKTSSAKNAPADQYTYN